ncbi:MAG: type VI secretion system ImpA family N-terminal domain-containing protein, partial [Candidatus Eisenbacteria bacterium]|nr:type VI secretion system ImpA family N-terminal domain-containing protein [Candidatus Eisenbacteria bacterium]
MPGGDSVIYEPEFEQIRAEIAKIDSLTGEIPDWNGVANLGVTILSSKAKDLTVAGYLVLGLFRTGGYAGLVGGLDLCRELLTNFWDTMYPEMARMRGRVAALSWMDERVSAAITRTPPATGDHETVKAAAESLKALYLVVNEKFGDAAPSIGDLRRSLDDAMRISMPTAAPAAAGAAASSGGAASGAPQTIDSPDAAYRVFRNAGNEIRRAAEYLIKQDPASPVPYLAQR